MAREFGVSGGGIRVHFSFTEPMRECCGKEFIISERHEMPSGHIGYWLSDYGYVFSEEMFEKTVTITEHLIRGNKVIVKLSNGRVGVAKCNPEDRFDVLYGTSLATLRAYKGKDANIEKRVTYCVSEEKQNKK